MFQTNSLDVGGRVAAAWANFANTADRGGLTFFLSHITRTLIRDLLGGETKHERNGADLSQLPFLAGVGTSDSVDFPTARTICRA